MGLLRPLAGGLLVLSVLVYEAERTKPAAFLEHVPATTLSDEERRLAGLLLDASTVEPFDLAAYRDLGNERLRAWIEAKVSGERIVAAGPAPQPQVVHLMEALRQSVQRAQENGHAVTRPRQRLAGGRSARRAPKQRKARA